MEETKENIPEIKFQKGSVRHQAQKSFEIEK